MPIMPTFFGSEKRTKPPEDDFWYTTPGVSTSAGVRVDEKTALKYLTVYACVTLIAGDVARLPLNLYRKRKDGGKDAVTDHRLYDLLHNAPNPETTSFNWREAAQGHLLLWGNTYAYIERDMTGQIIGLWQLPDPGQVEVKRSGNKIVYVYDISDGKGGTKKVTRTRDQIFHVPGYGFNGLFGLSMISVAREAVGMGLSTEQYGALFFGQGTHPSGTIEMDDNLGDDRDDYLEYLKKGYSELGKSHKIMLLENGMKYKQITIPMNDAQFLETRGFQKTEICGMYHVPPHKIAQHGANSNFNNLEQENGSYVDSCLIHWVTRWESQISLQLLSEAERRSGLFFEFNLSGLLRGDAKARAEYYNKIFQIGGIQPNEIRAKENMNPVDGGDQSFIMLNMVPLNKANEIVDKQLEGAEQPPDSDDTDDDVDELRGFFDAAAFQQRREQRSIQMRENIAARYRPLLNDAAQQIVNRESKAIKTAIRRADGDMDKTRAAIETFYETFDGYVVRKIGPVLKSYQLTVADASAAEVNNTSADITDDIRSYAETYALRHISSSTGQVDALETGDEIAARADEWMETRPEKIALDESVRAGNAAFTWLVFAAGMSVVWRIRGAETCPYCQELSGKRIQKGGAFLQAGEELDPAAGTGPMKMRGLKQHPPIHQGCDCYISAI